MQDENIFMSIGKKKNYKIQSKRYEGKALRTKSLAISKSYTWASWPDFNSSYHHSF